MSYSAKNRAYQIFKLPMPASSIMPTGKESGNEMAIEEFRFPFTPPKTLEEEEAIFIWVNSHLIFFMSLNVASFLAKNLARSLENNHFNMATSLYKDLIDLRAGHISYISCAANISQSVYESYVRPAMKSMSPDFSGLSSIDNMIFERNINELRDTISKLQSGWNERQRAEIAALDEAYALCEKEWWKEHTNIMKKLVPTMKSMALLTYEHKAKEEGLKISYREFLLPLRAPKALEINDIFFAVSRETISHSQFRNNFSMVADSIRNFQVENPHKLKNYWDRAEKTTIKVMNAWSQH